MTAYSGALALTYLSIYEGFGLPVVEAMSSACPVIIWNPSLFSSSHNNALKEISGSAALMINHTSHEALSRAILSLLNDEELRNHFVQSGLRRVKRFLHWDEAAKQWVSVLMGMMGLAR